MNSKERNSNPQRRSKKFVFQKRQREKNNKNNKNKTSRKETDA